MVKKLTLKVGDNMSRREELIETLECIDKLENIDPSYKTDEVWDIQTDTLAELASIEKALWRKWHGKNADGSKRVPSEVRIIGE